jgi:hypothetical protein
MFLTCKARRATEASATQEEGPYRNIGVEIWAEQKLFEV